MSWVDDDDARVDAALRRDAGLHAYGLGDLDPFYRPLSRFALGRGGAALVLYRGFDPPPLLLLARPADLDHLRALVREVAPDLPRRCYAHASPGALDGVPLRRVVERGPHLKMALPARAALRAAPLPAAMAVIRLGAADLPRVEALLAAAHPGNAFEPRSLALGACRGLADARGELVAMAGLHVLSAARGVAALGNVATRPDLRGRGLAAAATAAVVRDLPASVEVVALNVAAGNAPAIRCYERLGFEVVAPYDEVEVELELEAIRVIEA